MYCANHIAYTVRGVKLPRIGLLPVTWPNGDGFKKTISFADLAVNL